LSPLRTTLLVTILFVTKGHVLISYTALCTVANNYMTDDTTFEVEWQNKVINTQACNKMKWKPSAW